MFTGNTKEVPDVYLEYEPFVLMVIYQYTINSNINYLADQFELYADINLRRLQYAMILLT
jgi:hypothetical protein